MTRSFPRRSFGTILAILAALALGNIVAPSAEASRPGPRVPELDWQSCGGEFLSKLCATARVPLDYDHPRGRTIELALAKIPAADPDRRIGTVFINPGGPGNSGVEMAQREFGDILAQSLQGRFDVVGFDPRGVAGSDPLHCFGSEEELIAFIERPPVFPYRRAQQRPFLDHWRSLGPECLDDQQAIARHMSTADVARDMDLLRRAVGDSRLTYLGVSWGSYLGTTYANLFPGRIRALAIDGVIEPRLWSSGRSIEIDRVGPQRVLDEALRLCDAAGPACAFGVPGGSQARWRALVERIRREPVVLSPEMTYTYDLLIADAAGAMYEPDIWPDYFTFLDGIADAALGNRRAAAGLAAARGATLDMLKAPESEAEYANGFDAMYGNICNDAGYPKRLATWRAVGRYAKQGSEIGPRWWWFYAACADWPASADRYAGPWTARTSAPVLVVGNHYDAGTDYAGAQATARLLPNSRLLTYAGWGHTSYLRSECATTAINRYLLSGALPAKGTVCPANPSPFSSSADGSQSLRTIYSSPHRR